MQDGTARSRVGSGSSPTEGLCRGLTEERSKTVLAAARRHKYEAHQVIFRTEEPATHLGKSDCPEALKHFWSGHAPAHVSERYVKLLNDRAYRLDWAERVGTGFVLQLANLAYCIWYGKLRKLFETMVDEMGFEPPASSLRTQTAKLDGAELDGKELEREKDPSNSGHSE
jgi:hypothetical protein